MISWSSRLSSSLQEGVLSVKCKDSKWRLVAYIFKLLNETERNNEIYDKEMLAVICCLETWRHFLEGSQSKFKVWTNHKNLKYFMSNQKLNRRQARWVLYLSRFDFVLKYISESKIGKVDGLSRRLDWEVEVEKDNEEQVLVKKKWLEVKRIRIVEVIIEGIVPQPHDIPSLHLWDDDKTDHEQQSP